MNPTLQMAGPWPARESRGLCSGLLLPGGLHREDRWEQGPELRWAVRSQDPGPGQGPRWSRVVCRGRQRWKRCLGKAVRERTPLCTSVEMGMERRALREATETAEKEKL